MENLRASALPKRSAMSVLREATHSRHQELERSPLLLRAMDSRQDYSALLSALYGIYPRLENAIDNTPGMRNVLPDLNQRRKAAWLAQDLRFLGESPERVPPCDSLPHVGSTSRALGSMYVMEGATLGGQLLCREASRKLGLEDGDGVQFFSSYGQAVGPMWKEFGRAANSNLGGKALDEAVGAALAVFECFQNWLDE
jgi:heme oxygenase (biliverdin-IX-beta and delta-forming)